MVSFMVVRCTIDWHTSCTFLRVESALRYKPGQSSKSTILSEWLSFRKLFHYENKAQNSENVKGDSLANSRTDKK